MFFRLSGAVLALGWLLLLAGCDSAPGPAATPDGHAPVLSAFSFSPQGVALDALPPAQLDGDTARVPVSVSVKATAALRRLDRVGYVVVSPVPGGRPLASGVLTAGQGGTYPAAFTLAIPRAVPGKYTIRVYAVDETGEGGNEVLGLLNVASAGQPPRIDSAWADPAVVRPPVSLRIIAAVTDPDGPASIARVIGVTPRGGTFELFDDGASFGDETAGDGRYTARFDVPTGVTPGTQRFRIQATDRTGLVSNEYALDVVIE